MATKGRRRRQHAQTKPKSEPIPSGPTSVHHIPDHLLELVLLRVGSSLSLIRAASTCTRWRRIIADDTAFLTRFRSLHPAHVPGHYHIVDPSHDKLPPDGNNQVYVPADTSSSADALDRRHFSLDFLPDADWELGDSRGGLLLLYRRNIWRYSTGGELHFPDMIVCDPLTRRYQGILYWEEMVSVLCLGLFLLDGAAVDDETGGGVGISNFRVVAVLYEKHVFGLGRGSPLACVFSSGSDGGWQIGAYSGIPVPLFHLISFVGRARSSLYWRMEGEGAVLALDQATLEFSLVTFPDAVVGTPDESWAFRVIGGHHDVELRVVRIINNGDLAVFVQIQGSGEWVAEKLVRLQQEATTCRLPERGETYFTQPGKIVAANTRYILVEPQEKENWIVSVDLQTLEVEQAHERNRYKGAMYPYELQWPPALQACRGKAAGRRPLKRIITV